MTFAEHLIETAKVVKARATSAPGLERQRLHALADTLLAEARTQGYPVRLTLPAVFTEGQL